MGEVRMSERPKGALTKTQVIRAAKKKAVLYKVYHGSRFGSEWGELIKVKTLRAHKGMIETTPQLNGIHFSHWFSKNQRQWGYIFNNYFHALAYCLKVIESNKNWAKDFHIHI
jgi:hypothetical protein